jgi:hypothetical protein
MKDREFIELLNLYVDREISAADALRLEAAVLANPRRREVYDQYCRMQKACSMLSEDLVEKSLTAKESNVVLFPDQTRWGVAPYAVGLAAAAACAAAIIGVNFRNSDKPLAIAQDTVAARVAPAALVADSSPMKAVFVAKAPDVAASAVPQGTLLASAQGNEFNWIGDVQLAPVFNASNSDFLVNPKADMKAANLTDPANSRDAQEPAEMTAFRFQR